MGLFANLKTTTRVAVAFGVLLVMLAAVAATSMLRMRELSADMERVAVARVPKIIQSARAIETLLQGSRQMRNVLILDDESEIKAQLVDIARTRTDVRDALGQVEKLTDGDAEKAAFAEVQQHESEYEPLQDQYVALAQKGDYSTAKDFMLAKVRQSEAKYIDAISTLVEFQASSSEAAAREARERARTTNYLILGVSAGAGLLGILAAIVIIRSLVSRLGEKSYAAQIANGIASGDLTMQVEARKGDDAAILAAMKRMRDDLAEAVGSIRVSADAVSTAAGQIAAGNADLSSRTEEQASSLEETAASMEELAGTVKQNSENARQADELARGASQRAVQGGEDVSRVVDTMGEISTSASKIADIISVIDAIAFQTNILALNAAVEAARAGEQGRGFAVVASEVRSLAQRSADAAKEIKSLIGESVEKVANGKRAVEQAGATIDGLVQDVKRVSDLMGSIAEASAEQSRGVQQVNKTVTEMDKVVQQNAAAVQQSVAAAESMRQQAQVLARAVATFRLAEDGGKQAQPPEAAPEAARVLARVKRRAAENPQALVATATGTTVAAQGDEWEEF